MEARRDGGHGAVEELVAHASTPGHRTARAGVPVHRAPLTEVRESRGTEDARVLKRTRYILLKNPWNLTNLEGEKLAQLQRTNKPIYRAYLLKEGLAGILDGLDVDIARGKLRDWIGWAARSRLEPFKKLARTVKEHFEGILAYIPLRLNNGRTEGTNGKIRVITRRSYGFHSATNLIALIFLCCSGLSLTPVLKVPQTRAAASSAP
jgi:transposase